MDLAIEYNHTKVIKFLHAAGSDINHQNYYGWTPLIKTSAWGYLQTVKLLVNLGAELDLLGFRYNETALMMSALYGHLDVVEFLVKSGADLEIRDTWNMTALDWATWYNQTEIVQVLKNGTEFNRGNGDGDGEELNEENEEENP